MCPSKPTNSRRGRGKGVCWKKILLKLVSVPFMAWLFLDVLIGCHVERNTFVLCRKKANVDAEYLPLAHLTVPGAQQQYAKPRD